jgi:hypothetical protein
MHKNATKCNKTQSKWCINKHGASKIIDTFEMYHALLVIFHVYDAKKNPGGRTGYPENYWNPFFVSPKCGKRLG